MTLAEVEVDLILADADDSTLADVDLILADLDDSTLAEVDLILADVDDSTLVEDDSTLAEVDLILAKVKVGSLDFTFVRVKGIRREIEVDCEVISSKRRKSRIERLLKSDDALVPPLFRWRAGSNLVHPPFSIQTPTHV